MTCHQAQLKDANLLVVYLRADLYQATRVRLCCHIGREQVQPLRMKGGIGTTERGAACFDTVASLQAEMAGSPDTAAILDALNSQRADARERQAAMERQIREEARRLRGGVAGECCSLLTLECCHAQLPLLRSATEPSCSGSVQL